MPNRNEPATAQLTGPEPASSVSADPQRDKALIESQTAGELTRAYKRHIPELDGLRALAVAMVVFSHIAINFYAMQATGPATRLLALWVRFTRLGFLGVDVFFVLSGFLITGVLLDALGKPHFYRNFYARRALRIFPLYFVVLFLMLAWYWPLSRSYFVLSVFMVSNLAAYVHIYPVLPVLWSLSVEEHFYLFWPWVVRYLRPRMLALVSVAILVAEPALRFLCFGHPAYSEYASWFRFDGMAMGALLAIVLRSRFAPRLRAVGASLLGLSLLGFAALTPFGIDTRTRVVGSTFSFLLIALATAGIIALTLAQPDARWSAPLRWRAARFLGDISFCVYLVHWFALSAWSIVYGGHTSDGLNLRNALHPLSSYALEVAVVFGFSCVIGYLSLRFFEG